MFTSSDPGSPTRSDSKTGTSTKIETPPITTPAPRPQHVFFDLPLESRRKAYFELLFEICVQDIHEIKNVFQLRPAVGELAADYEWEWSDLTLQRELREFIENGGMVSAEKAKCVLANPEAAYEIRVLLDKESFLFVEADRWSICEIVRLLFNLRINCVVLDLRWAAEFHLFSKRFLEAARRAGIKLEELGLFCAGGGQYSWVSTFHGHEEVLRFEESRWVREGEDADAMNRCDTKGNESCWCQSQITPAVDRREIIARDGQISDSFRSFLGQLQADDDDE